MTLEMTKAELRTFFAKLRAMMADGKEQDEIAATLGLSAEEFQEVLRRFYESESDTLRSKSREQVYVEYCIAQAQNIRDLTALLAQYREMPVPSSAAVGAIKARSDIQDKIITKGQELGFVEKKTETKVIAGVILSQLTTPELRKAIAVELGNLEKLCSDFADAPDILGVPTGPIHRSAPKKKALPPPQAMNMEDDANVIDITPEPQPSPLPPLDPSPQRMRTTGRHRGHTARGRRITKAQDA